jgi:hypothetical protein
VKEAVYQKRYCFTYRMTLFTAAAITAAFLFQGCQGSDLKRDSFKTEYQAVLLAGGMAYYGKMDKVGNQFIEMADVHYVQNRQNPETKEVQGILVKRGKEWHEPDRMYLNTAHVIMIEPVAPDSQIAKMIRELKAKGTEEKK